MLLDSAEQRDVNSGLLRLIACPSLALEHGRIDRYVQPGATVAGHLRALGWNPDPLFARVFIDGVWIEKAQWEYAVPRDGQALTIRVIPMGGGEGNKSALRIVAMIAIIAASIAIAQPELGVGAFLSGAAGFGSAAGWGAVAAATLSIAGSLAISALIPPAQANMAALSGQGNSSPTLSLTGSSNQIAPYSPVPRVYGTHLLYPPKGALEFTEIVGTDQYLRLLFCCGYGPLVLGEFKIGTTPLDQFTGVELEVRYGYASDAPLTLYTSDVFEDGLSIKLVAAAGRQVRRSQANTQELSVDVAFPSGLVAYDNKGNPTNRTVSVEVAYRPATGGAWIVVGDTAAIQASGNTWGLTFTAVAPGSAGNNIIIAFKSNFNPSDFTIIVKFAPPTSKGPPFNNVSQNFINIYYTANHATATQIRDVFNASVVASKVTAVLVTPQTIPAKYVVLQLTGGADYVYSIQATAASPQLQRRSIRWNVPPGVEYEIGVTRVTADTTDSNIHDVVYWTVLRTIQASQRLYPVGMAMIALRIKATDQLNGTVNQFNCIATSILPDWDGTNWQLAPTSNPASVYRDVLQGTANSRPKADSRLDLATIQDFHDRCAAQGFEFNAVIDFKTTVKQLRQNVLASGRGALGLRDMKYSVIQDLLQASPVDVITPRTSSGFRWSKRFLDPIHAFTVRFVDAQKSWQQAERIVYADGYSAANATIFESVDAGIGVTNSDQVYKLKRRELAEAFLRADDYSVEMDFANLTCTRGDRVQLQHDVILAGLLTARIKTVTVDGGGNATSISFDDLLTMETGKSYGVRIKKSTGTQLVQALVTSPGDINSVSFTAPIAAGSIPAIGDLALFGLLGSESLDCIVKAIMPGADYAATVQLLDYAPAIQSADSGPIPPFDSHVTLPATTAHPIPATPLLVSIQSDETVLVRQSDGALGSRILIFVAFSSGVGFPAAFIQAQFRESGTAGVWRQLYAPVSGSAAEISIVPVADGIAYDVRIRGVSEAGATSEWLTLLDHVVIGKTTPPPGVPTLQRDGDRLVWAYPDAPLDFAGFVLRRHFGSRVLWADAQAIHDGLLTGTSWPLPGDLNIMTYLIKAVDSAGHESATANYITIDLGSLLVDNLLFTEDKKAANFPGTHNGLINAGNLEANTAGTFWSGNDDASFWSGTDSNLFWMAQYLTLDYVTSLIPDADKVPCTLLLDLTVTAQFYSLEYRVSGKQLFWSGTDSNLFWSGTDSTLMWTGSGMEDGWLPWLGQLEQATRQVYEWRVRTAPGPVKGQISKYLVKVDVPDVVEPYKDMVIAATTGTRLTLTKSYRAIKNIELNLVNDAGTALTATIEDYGTGGPPLTSGPLIKTRDAARAAVAGKISGRIQGY